MLLSFGSGSIGPAEWLQLADLSHAAVATDPQLAGIVVTHGTATLEKTAYFLTLAVKASVPEVVVGAVRPSTALGAGSGMNLLASRAAGSLAWPLLVPGRRRDPRVPRRPEAGPSPGNGAVPRRRPGCA